MKIETYLSIFIIGFCYSLLLINKIIFGTLLSLGLLTLIFLNKKSLVQDLKTCLKNINKKRTFDTTSFYFLLLYLSFKLYKNREIYTCNNLFIPYSFFLIYTVFNFYKKKEYADLLFKVFSISLFINCFVITTYNFSNFDFF